MNVQEAIRHGKDEIGQLSETAGLDAQVLLGAVLERPRSWLLAHPERELTEEEAFFYHQGLQDLHCGRPLPYIVGEWEFYALPFFLTPAVLIPRPETELLVDEALKWLTGLNQNVRAADVGTGSGCIAISLAVHAPGIRVHASDISAEALSVARKNGRRHRVTGKIDFIEQDLLVGAAGKFDLICANLPYIPSGTLAHLDVYKKEPALALDGGSDGLELIRKLLLQASRHIQKNGLILLEIESEQGKAVRDAARAHFPQAEIRVLQDLAGRDRLLRIERSIENKNPSF